ncbi:MAG: type II toxin-antitoxin system RelE/ParE family toxin [Xanthomonadales bacterium]|nr:type II toxin-antitoxin system RelE/ParE family toxin [Xanthomonadales bacterium]
MKPVEWRPQARRDADDAAFWYAQQDRLALGERFILQVAATLEHLSHFPATGSTRHDGIVPGLHAPLRFFPVMQFERYLVYYLDLPTHVDVIRIWCADRGLDALMEDDECH